MLKYTCIGLFLLLLLAPVYAAEQQGLIVRQATVYADASSVSQQVGKLSAGTQVGMFSRKGGWQEIFSEEKSIIGWVRSYQVRSGDFTPAVATEAEADSRGFLSGLAALSRKASGFFKYGGSSTSSGTATIGVRGLSEEEIKTAVADFAELEKMKQFASNRKQAEAFARQGRLKTNNIAHLKK